MDFSHNELRQTFSYVPDRYDDVRPSYPAAVVDTALRRTSNPTPLNILEVGCGTGRATRMLGERGHTVVAMDLSRELVAVAERKLADLPNVRFEVGPFESMPVPAAPFDLIASAQAFHWIEPTAGMAQVCRLLAPGGAIALFWNFIHYDATPLLSELRNACVQHIPLFASWPDASNARLIAFANQWRGAVNSAPCLDMVFETIVPTTIEYSHEHFLTLITTYSWFLSQRQPVRDALLAELRALLNGAPDPLILPFRTLLISAVRPG